MLRVMCLLLLSLMSLWAQVSIQVPGLGPTWTLGRNLAWGASGRYGIENYFLLTSPNARGLCVQVQNHDSADHVAWVSGWLSWAPDAVLWNLEQWMPEWTGYWAATSALDPSLPVVPANSSVRYWFFTGGAPRVAIRVSGTSGNGTADLFASVSDEPCVAPVAARSFTYSATGEDMTHSVPVYPGLRAAITSVEARCSAGTSTLSIERDSSVLWSTESGGVGATLYRAVWPDGFPVLPDTVVKMVSCGSTNTGYLTFVVRQVWER